MPIQRVYVTFTGGRETIMDVMVPKGSDDRVSEYLRQYFSGMRGVSSWRQGFDTRAANADNHAYQAFMSARRNVGLGAVKPDRISYRLPTRKKHQKYPR